MRKYSVTAFAILYALLIFSATAERSKEAVAGAPTHSGSGRSDASFCKLRQPETRLTQTKINEPGFVVEISREAVAAPTLSRRHTPVPTFTFRTAWIGPFFSSRAPPSQI